MNKIQLNLVALGCFLAAFTSCLLVQAAGPVLLLRDFKELSSTATKLESAEMMMLSSKPSRQSRQRDELLYMFAREVKSTHCGKFFDQMLKTSDEFRIKAYAYVDETKKQKNWWGNIVSTFDSPLKGMKSLSKFDSYLSTVTERYESQAKSGQLKTVDVDCDMIRFQVRSLHAIMFVLQTDIKYLVMENQQTLNQAIYEQLKADKFVSNVNFYEIHELTGEQRELLLKYFADRNNTEETTVGQAVDHFFNPGQYIIGRLLDSCQTVLRFEDDWKEREQSHNDVCPQSTSDPNGELFPKHFKFDKYDDTFKFCQNFLDAL